MPSKLNAGEILERARAGAEGAAVGRVFGAPIERDGVTVVPVAVVSGGGGGGSGSGSGGSSSAAATSESIDDSTPEGEGEGSGGGFGFSARPAGVYVIRNGEVSWRPAVDINKIVAGGQLVAIAAFLVARSVLRRRRRR